MQTPYLWSCPPSRCPHLHTFATSAVVVVPSCSWNAWRTRIVWFIHRPTELFFKWKFSMNGIRYACSNGISASCDQHSRNNSQEDQKCTFYRKIFQSIRSRQVCQEVMWKSEIKFFVIWLRLLFVSTVSNSQIIEQTHKSGADYCICRSRSTQKSFKVVLVTWWHRYMYIFVFYIRNSTAYDSFSILFHFEHFGRPKSKMLCPMSMCRIEGDE